MKENGKRGKIIRVGFDLFDKFGYNGTSINEIIKVARIPKGSFYHYFESKEAFMIEVMKDYSFKVCDCIDNYLRNKSIEPDKRIKKMYHDFVESYENTGAFPYGSFASKINSEVGDKYPKIRKSSNEVYCQIIESHAYCLRKSKLNSNIRSALNKNEIAQTIVYCWEGAVLRMQSTSRIEPLHLFQNILNNYLLKID
ncbi:MAG: TetR/AcrR family transcriptional regulator [Bacteroidetes bacterium]|jgi:TetR/AcrR family transcriptional regulator, transcriptional repressor for nem operon|nr:TetR/AcrR family transcriptional regulator [Bacteroidota bacterium]MBT6685609.1 TetR/AcrR family transcriptional regulator [Bacteroidota bacterium]MBT7144711.1 TetR/AcrR family transcriptional regulator [Bacteroidota bacterium]MBT7490091.1 TetR/AcrR family transcriptional regulator [Bacteroidota bacterium]